MSGRDIYTHGHQDSVLRSHRWRTAGNSAAYLLPRLRRTDRVLDVGCGPGTLTADLARQVPDGHVVGIDVAEGVIEEARSHAVDAGVGNVSFLVGDFRQLVADEPFDVVHAHQVLQHLRDPVEALSRMAALAKPDGLIAAQDGAYSGFIWTPPNPQLDQWLEVYLAVARHNGAEPDAGRHLLRWARAAGLADIKFSASVWAYATPEDRTWWGDLWAERSTASSFAAQAVEYGIATRPDLNDLADGWRRWAADDDATLIIPHGEILASPPR